MKNLRNSILLSQKELAALTGVSPSAISLCEKGCRHFPSNVTTKLSEIQLLQQQAQQKKGLYADAPFKFHEAQLAKLEKQLHTHIRKATADALRISLILSKKQERYKRLSEKMLLIGLMKEKAVPGTREMSLLEVMEMETLGKMKSCSRVQQMATRYRLIICDAKKQAAIAIQDDLYKIK